MPETFDLVVLGGGHNGLVTAALLAKTGWSVCVLERRHNIGGGCATEERLAAVQRQKRPLLRRERGRVRALYRRVGLAGDVA